MLWLFITGISLVSVEPAPYDLFPCWYSCSSSGLSRNGAGAPLVAFLLLYNLGGAAASFPFSATSASASSPSPATWRSMPSSSQLVGKGHRAAHAHRRSGWIWAALIASVAAILGCFDVAAHFAPVGRAGTFKDPNVYATFLAAPIVFLVQSLMTGTARRAAGRCLPAASCGRSFLSILARRLGGRRPSVLAMAGLTCMSSRLRSRILISTVVGAILVVASSGSP